MPVVDMRRLTMLMGMTTSSHDGEALNALRLANRLIKSVGMTWEEVLAGKAQQAPGRRERSRSDPPRQEKPKPKPNPGMGVCIMCRHMLDADTHGKGFTISPWEREFLESILRWGGSLTEKQEVVYRRILQRFRDWEASPQWEARA